jgi:hypothetical protein
MNERPGPQDDAEREGTGPFAFLTPRTLLKHGLGALAVPAAGVTGLLGLRGCAPDIDGLLVLGDHGYRTFSALARLHIPRGGPFAEGADDFDLARAFDAYLSGEPEDNVRDLTRALHLIELGPVVFDHRLATFSNLPHDEQDAHWRSWGVSERLVQRQVAVAFRKFLALVFYDQPAVWPHIGYPGPSLLARGTP